MGSPGAVPEPWDMALRDEVIGHSGVELGDLSGLSTAVEGPVSLVSSEHMLGKALKANQSAFVWRRSQRGRLSLSSSAIM